MIYRVVLANYNGVMFVLVFSVGPCGVRDSRSPILTATGRIDKKK